MWEGLECELCKTNYEDAVVHKGKRMVDFLGVDMPKDSHFLFLESVNTEEILKTTRVKVVHIIDFKNLKSVTLGRGHDREVRITDISISRMHCKLKVIKNEIWLEDLNSKFGCLELLNDRPLELGPNETAYVQKGRTYIEFKR